MVRVVYIIYTHWHILQAIDAGEIYAHVYPANDL